MFIWVFGELRQLCAKFGKIWAKIHREMICQSWLLLTPFFNFPIVQWLHFFSFSPLCVLKCALKLPAWEDKLAAFDFSPLLIYSLPSSFGPKISSFVISHLKKKTNNIRIRLIFSSRIYSYSYSVLIFEPNIFVFGFYFWAEYIRICIRVFF